MENKKNWGNPYNANYSAKIGDDVNKQIHSSSFFEDKDELDKFAVTNILLRELCGTYKFETEDKKFKKFQNTFWWNINFYGRVGIYKIDEDNIIVVNVSNTVYTYDKLVEARITPARISFSQAAMSYTLPTKSILVKGKSIENLVVVSNDITSEYFYIKYGWFVDRNVANYKKYVTSTEMKNKKLAVFSSTNNQTIIKSLDESFRNSKPYIEFKSPLIAGDITKDAKSAMETNYKMEKLDFPSDSYMGIHDVMAYWKWGKDILGMNENSSDTKERVISTEIESSTLNTLQIEETQLRGFEVFTDEIKEQFGIDLTIKRVKDEQPKIENSEQAFTQGVNENE